MNEYSAYVTTVIDGDTFKTSNQTIRMANINAPESGTLAAQRSTAYLRWLIDGKQVRIKSVATDFYRRVVAHVWRESDDLYINKEMFDRGYVNLM
ncbi:MAG: thermonuclease family protein [Candidatus Poribacteria bacterium]|nr:thermonuclease family protein [Candidatus Poribacteria bacterium]